MGRTYSKAAAPPVDLHLVPCLGELPLSRLAGGLNFLGVKILGVGVLLLLLLLAGVFDLNEAQFVDWVGVLLELEVVASISQPLQIPQMRHPIDKS